MRVWPTFQSICVSESVDGFYSAAARLPTGQKRGSTDHLVTLAEPALRQLRDRSGLTALMSVRVDTTLLCLDRHSARHATRLTFQRGSAQPLYAGCSAEVLLAYAPTVIVEEVLSGPMRAKTARTPSRTDLRKRLTGIRQRGFAISKGEINPDAIGVAAPVFRMRTCVCVISAAGPAAVMSGAKLRRTLEHVQATCRQLTQVLDDNRHDTAWLP